MDKEEKLKARQAVIDKVNKTHGKGSAILGPSDVLNVEVIPTGSLGLDRALGAGGYPRGRIIEIYGPEASGKSTTTLHAIAEAQKRGGLAALIDAEHATDPVYAASIGVDMDELVLTQPDYGEQALDIAEEYIDSGVFDIVVVDSVAALVPKAEIEATMESNSIGLQARMMSQGMRKLTSKVAKTKTVLFFVNQTREKIGVMYGNPTTTPGGNALKFHASVRLEIRRTLTEAQKKLKSGGEHTAVVKVVKNKVAPPFKQADYPVIHGIGIDRAGEVIEHAVKAGIIEKGGAWYTWGEERIQGLQALKDAVLRSPEVIDDLENQVRKIYGIPTI